MIMAWEHTGAVCKVIEIVGSQIRVKWDKTSLSNNQRDGKYYSSRFRLMEKHNAPTHPEQNTAITCSCVNLWEGCKCGAFQAEQKRKIK